MKKTSRILALLMTLMMVISMFGVHAYAAEETYTETDTYVLNFSSQDVPGYEDWDERRLYASPYRTDIYVTEEGKLANWNWCSANVMNMINTTRIGTVENAEEPYASIAVYCVDAVTDGDPGWSYRRVNLEDSGFFSDAVAGRIRAIITNSFPHTSEADVAAAVNAWDDANGDKYAEVENLNYAEIISATQSVIWTLTNEGKLGDPVYAGYTQNAFGYSASTGESDQIVYDKSMAFAESENTPNNINAVAAYLNALAPMAAQDAVISDASIGDIAMEIEEAEDGTFTVTVTAVVAANVDGDDDLELTAVMGGKVVDTQAVVDGTNTYTVTINGLETADQAVTIHIDGTQTASDVFLFDPLNGRDASQTMAGFVEGDPLPVHAEATVAPRILDLTKIDKITKVVTGEDGTETTVEDVLYLKNIQFEIYYVCSMEEYVTGEVPLADAPNVTEEELALYVTDQTPVVTLTTDENGKAAYNFTANGQEDGIYIVRELSNDAVVAPMAPFYIAVPMTNADGSVSTTISISPKNDVKDEDVEIEKDVNEIDNDHDTHDVGEVHTWIIQSSIPMGLADGLKYEITDTLSYQLTYVGNVVVTVSEKAAAAHEDLKELVEGEDYNLTVTPGTDENGEEITSFKVALTRSGMEKVAAVEGTEPEVRVYFDAYIDEDAILGTEIPNQAHISYENNVGVDFDRDSDDPEVHTGGISLVKVDASNGRKLAGAKFTLNIRNDAGEYVPVAFYDNAAMTGEKVFEADTDENGNALFWGLKYGTYYLIETEAPEGYNLLPEPVQVEIGAGSHLAENVLTVKNSSKFQLPETGGIGTAVFTFGGAGIIGAAALVLLGGKKKRS